MCVCVSLFLFIVVFFYSHVTDLNYLKELKSDTKLNKINSHIATSPVFSHKIRNEDESIFLLSFVGFFSCVPVYFCVFLCFDTYIHS